MTRWLLTDQSSEPIQTRPNKIQPNPNAYIKTHTPDIYTQKHTIIQPHWKMSSSSSCNTKKSIQRGIKCRCGIVALVGKLGKMEPLTQDVVFMAAADTKTQVGVVISFNGRSRLFLRELEKWSMNWRWKLMRKVKNWDWLAWALNGGGEEFADGEEDDG